MVHDIPEREKEGGVPEFEIVFGSPRRIKNQNKYY